MIVVGPVGGRRLKNTATISDRMIPCTRQQHAAIAAATRLIGEVKVLSLKSLDSAESAGAPT